jgi:addiction module HigA family antidote
MTEMAQVRIPSDRPPTPPGEMLLEEFIRPLGMTQAELADRIGVSYVRLNEIVNGRRGITPSTALRLANPDLSSGLIAGAERLAARVLGPDLSAGV